MLENLRRKIAELIHPEKSNFEYWLMKSIERTPLAIKLVKYKEYRNPKKVKGLAQQLKENELLGYFFNEIEHGEIDFMARKAESTNPFLYSRAIIHVIQTLREKIIKASNYNIEDKKEFNKFDII